MKARRWLLLVVGLVWMVGGGQASFGQGPEIQSYTNAEGTLTFDYPVRWASSDYIIMVALSNETSLAESIRGFDMLDAGQVVIYITRPFDLNRPDTSYTHDKAVEMVYRAINLTLRIPGELPMADEPYLDHPAVQSRFSTEGYDFHGLAFELEPSVVVGIALVTALGEMVSNAPIMTAIIESMRYTSPPLPVEKGSVVWQYQDIENDFDSPIRFIRFGPVAVGPNGYVHMRGYDDLYTWDAAGNFLSEFGLGVQVFAEDIAVGPDGTIWYAEESGDGDVPGWVEHLAADGRPLGHFDLGLELEEAFTDRPQFIAVDSDGVAYAAFLIEGEEADETRIRVLSPEFLDLEREFVLEDVVEPIRDMKIGPDGLLYILVGGKLRIHDLEGRLVEEPKLALLTEAWRIAIAPDGKRYIATRGGAIMCYDSADNYLYQFGRPLPDIESNEPTPLEPGQLGALQDLAIAPNGDLVVTDYGYGYGRVMQITFSGD